MKTKMTGMGLVVFVFLLTGCATSPERTRTLEAQSRELSRRLQIAEDRVATLEKANVELSELLQRQRDVAKTLGKEKAVHMTQVGDLRSDTRRFLSSQISFLREFSQKTELLDYVGGELISRQHLDGKNQTLVDLENRIPSGGSVFGSWGHFAGSCTYLVSILRKVDEKWFAVWQSEPCNVVNTGLQKFDFRVPVSVEKGDIIAYTFRGAVGVTHDRGTGATVYVNDELKTGSSVKRSHLRGESDKRAYSIGVVGIFE